MAYRDADDDHRQAHQEKGDAGSDVPGREPRQTLLALLHRGHQRGVVLVELFLEVAQHLLLAL